MGREVRRVPANWDHPKIEGGRSGALQPMFDQTFEDAATKWKADFSAWERGERPDYCSGENRTLEFWEWDGGPPDRPYYRPWKDEEATWFQVRETVTEGTPVTPPFATAAELVDYLVANGDFWDQKRWASGDRFMQPKKPGWDREAAEKFVGVGWAPSMIVVQSAAGAQIYEARDGAPGQITQ